MADLVEAQQAKEQAVDELRAALARCEEVAAELAREKRSSAFLRNRFAELSDEFGLAPEDHAGMAKAARAREGSHAALRKIAELLGMPTIDLGRGGSGRWTSDQVAEAAARRLGAPSWLSDLWIVLDGGASASVATGGTIHQALQAVQDMRASHRRYAETAANLDAALERIAGLIGLTGHMTYEQIEHAVGEAVARHGNAAHELGALKERHASVVNVLADAQGLILRLASRIGVRDGEDVEAALVRFLEALPGEGLDAVRRTLEARTLVVEGGTGAPVFLGGRGGQTPGADGEDGQGIGGGVGGKGGRGGGQ